MNPDIYREIKRQNLFLEYAPGQILNENVLARDGMEMARVRHDALVRHFNRIRAKYLGVVGEVKL
jgi:hypothetical protein